MTGQVEREAAAAPVIGRRRRLLARLRELRLSLHATLLVLMVGLLLLTTLVITVLWLRSLSASIETLSQRFADAVALATASEIANHLDPAVPVLEQLRYQVLRGHLRLDRSDELGDELAALLRYHKELTWLSFADADTGRFVGAQRRPDGTLVLNQSQPGVDDGRPTEVVVNPDGTRGAPTRLDPSDYDPRRQGWFQAALDRPGIVWYGPYTFYEGAPGLSATLDVRSADGAARGVFTADFSLQAIRAYLTRLARDQSVRIFLLSRQGEPIVASDPFPGAPTEATLAATLAALPWPIDSLDPNAPVWFPVEADGVRYFAAVALFPVEGGTEFGVALLAREDVLLGPINDDLRASALVFFAGIALALVLGYLLSERVSRPLRVISAELDRVGRFQLSPEPAPRSVVKEIAVVGEAVDTMKASLRSFGRYVPRDVVRDLIASRAEAQVGGQVRTLTLHFSDVKGFTSMSETREPEALVRQLSQYLEAMTAVIETHGGTVDKFIGDGIVALFNAPGEVPDHPRQACRAALGELAALAALNRRWTAEGLPPFQVRIGLHCGEAVVGNIGTPERFAYTAIGDAVNLASRLETLNKLYGTAIIASDAVRAAAGPEFAWRRLDRVAVAGRQAGILIHELLGDPEALDPAVLAARDAYEAALDLYLGRRFAEAADAFALCARRHPADTAAAVMAMRARHLAVLPPGAAWDGVYQQPALH